MGMVSLADDLSQLNDDKRGNIIEELKAKIVEQ